LTDDVLPPEALYSDIYATTPPQKVLFHGLLGSLTEICFFFKIRRTTPDFVQQPYTTTNELLKAIG
jgi:hypothetical protein